MPAPADQADHWNGPSGQAWVEAQSMLDPLYAPIARRLVEAAGPGALLDIGCGAGATTLALARRPGAERTLGVDISEPMIAAARTAAAREGVAADFLVADAGSHAFEPDVFDRIVSRFGIMFFADPIAAFANLRRAARPGAGLHGFVWRGMDDNPFMTAAERAAAPHLPGLAAREPDTPGQFGLADGDRTAAILAASGWSGIAILPFDFDCVFPADRLETWFTRLGPVAAALRDVGAGKRAEIVPILHAAFAPYVEGDQVRFTAACWEIQALA